MIKSGIKCPTLGIFAAFNCYDAKKEEIATFAYIEGLFKLAKYKDLQPLPKYIIVLISRWVHFDIIHLIQRWDARSDIAQRKKIAKHWTMKLDDILQSAALK